MSNSSVRQPDELEIRPPGAVEPPEAACLECPGVAEVGAGAMKRMSMKQFCRVVRDVMATLPKEFRPYLDNVVVDVEEEPDEKTLRKAGLTDEEIAAGETLLGLFDPLELPGPYAGDFV